MELIFLGRGAAFNAEEGNTSAYFIEEEKLFLIDCGESVFKTLKENNILSSIKEVYVLISHLHCDHCGSLGTLGLYCKYVLQTKMHFIVPHHEEYKEQLRMLMHLYGNNYTYEFIYDDEIDGVFKTFDSVRYDLTKHYDEQICFSFVFETKEGAIFFSADTKTLDNLKNFISKYPVIDKIYMEATDLRMHDDVHLNIEDMFEAIPKHLHNRVFMMHLRSESCKNKVIELGLKIVKIDL